VRELAASVNFNNSMSKQYGAYKVPAQKIIDLLENISIPGSNTRFDPKSIANFIKKYAGAELKEWDTVIISGDGEKYDLTDRIVTNKSKRGFDLRSDDKFIRMSKAKTRIGGRGDTAWGLTDDQKEAVKIFFKPKSLSNDHYFSEDVPQVKDRRPLLLIYLIELKDAESSKLKDFGKDPIVGFGVGIPHLSDEETKYIRYQISVEYYAREDGKTVLSFGLEDNSLSDLFYNFCEDIIESTRGSDPKEGFLPIINRWNTWIKFFTKVSLPLTEMEIRGLIGEVYFLREFLIQKYNVDQALEAFIGIDKAHKDFEIENTWYEVKTIHNGAHTTKISSIEQLDSDKDGFLAVVTLDQGTLGLDDCVTLNKIVNDFRANVSEKNAAIFDEKMRKAGYVYDERYDEFTFIIIHLEIYEVTGEFPRIKKEMLPTGIVKAGYELDLETVKDYKVMR
jgi:hypothetical protein